MKMRHRVKVNNGKMVFANLEGFKADIRSHEGKEIYLTIGKGRNTRSDSQNRYYWGVIVRILVNELGYFDDEIHEFLKEKFLPKKHIALGGYEFDVATSTSRLSTKEFEDFASKVRAWASSDLNIFIPLPNEVEY